jgi:DNA polymerase-4
VGRRRRHRLRGRTVQVKVRFADFRTITRAHTLTRSTNSTHEIWQAAADLLERCLPTRCPGIRLLGVGMSGFESPEHVQRTLFDDPDERKHRQLDAAADQIQAKFGPAALNRGSGLMHNARHRPPPRPAHPASPSDDVDDVARGT